MLAGDLFQRILAKQRVIAVVAKRRRPLRRVLEPRLIKLIKQFILLSHTIGYRRTPQRQGTTAREQTRKEYVAYMPT